MALRATKPGMTKAAGTGAAPAQTVTPAGTGAAPAQTVAPAATNVAPAQTVTPAQTPAQTPATNGSAMQDLNAGILDNIEGMDSAGNYVTMDGTNFLYKSTEATAPEIDLIVNYGKRYYQFVDDSDIENKQFHNSDTKLDDRYKLRFEIRWDEESEEGEISTAQFHMPTASAMRFIDYVKALAKAGYGIGQVVTRMSISRQTQKNSTNRYSRAEFTMIGALDENGEFVEMVGPTTVGKK